MGRRRWRPHQRCHRGRRVSARLRRNHREGIYGTLVVRTDGGSSATWTYTLKLGMDERGIDDMESFGMAVSDIYGGHQTSSLDITLKPLTHAPECGDVLVDWGKTESGRPVSFMEEQLDFSDADMAYDPTESLHLAINGVAVTESVQIAGKYGKLTIGPDGSFIYNYALGTENFDVLEDFTYTETDSRGYSDTAHLYIRLSDDAPAFPVAEQAAFASESPQDASPTPDGDTQGNAPDTAPEPVEIELANVPLPYDPADTGMAVASLLQKDHCRKKNFSEKFLFSITRLYSWRNWRLWAKNG